MSNFLSWIRGSLIRRLVGPSLVLSIVAVMLVGLISYTKVRNILTETTRSRLSGALDQHAAEMKRWVEDQQQDIVFLSRTPFFRDNVADILSYKNTHRYYSDAYKDLSEFLFSYIKNYPGIREIMILSGIDGRVLVSTSKEHEGQYRADYSYFDIGKEQVVTHGVYSWSESGEPAITVARPLLDALGLRKGVLAVHLDLDRMAQVVLRHYGLGETGETYVVDRKNQLISAQRSGQPQFVQKAYSSGISQAIRGRQGFGLYDNYAGVPVIGSYRWLPELELALLAELSQDEAFAAARMFGLLIIGIGTVFSGILFAGNLAAARRIASPLMDLSRMASRVSAGDLSVEIAVRNEDETGALARSFNSMVAQLSRLYSELKTNVTYFHTVFQLSPNSIAVLNFETGIFTDANESFGNLFGFRTEETIGQTLAELDIWQSRTDSLRLMSRLRKHSTVQGMELHFKRRDGSFFVGLLSARLIELEGVPHAITVLWDISGQQRTEEELRSSKERLQLLFDNMPVGCIAWNENFEVELWNPTAASIFGYSREEAHGRHAHALIVPPESVADVNEVLRKLLDGDSGAQSENINMTKNGRRISCDWHNTPLRDQSGRFVGLISMARDITEQKVTEGELERYRLHLEDLVAERTRQLEEAQDELVEKERLAVLGQLTATVSHELRNPLGTVANAIFSIRHAFHDGQTEKVEKALALADRSVRRCDSIISELLDFTRSHELIYRPLDLGSWLVGLIEEQRIPEGVALSWDLPSGFVVEADAERLRRAVINVLDNAVQALGEISHPVGKIFLSLKQEKGRIGIDVVDNGPGITEDVIGRIFEPLFSTKGFGVGLGMSVVKNIMEDYGGEVVVSSVPGQGTAVTLWMPALREEG